MTKSARTLAVTIGTLSFTLAEGTPVFIHKVGGSAHVRVILADIDDPKGTLTVEYVRSDGKALACPARYTPAQYLTWLTTDSRSPIVGATPLTVSTVAPGTRSGAATARDEVAFG